MSFLFSGASRRAQLVAALLATTCLHPAFTAYAQTLTPRVETASRQVTRSIALTELGFADGAKLTGSVRGKDIHFPVPANMRLGSPVLTLAYDTATAYEGRRSLEVSIGDRIVLVRPVTARQERQSIRIPLDGVDTSSGFVKVSVRYDRLGAEDKCVAVNLAGDHLTVLPESALTFGADREALNNVATALALMPREVDLFLPPRMLTPGEFGAAFEIARGLRHKGHVVRFDTLAGADVTASIFRPASMTRALAPTPEAANTWTRGAILIASRDEAQSLAGNQANAALKPFEPALNRASTSAPGLSLVQYGTGPALLIAVENPGEVARMISSSWRTAAVSPTFTSANVTNASSTNGALTFDRLRQDIGARDLVDRAQWSLNVSAKDIPAGRRLSGLRLQVAVAPDETNSRAVVSAFFNDMLMKSVVASEEAHASIDFNLPEGLAGMHNNLRVVVQRQAKGGNCVALPVGYPAQLLGSSELVTTGASDTPRDFFDLPPRFRDGLTLFVEPGDMAMQRARLATLTELAASTIPADAPITVRFVGPNEKPAPTGPFVSFTESLPEGAVAPIRFDAGRVVVRSPDGANLADFDGLAGALTAQIVSVGAHPGLWLRTAADTSETIVPARLQLDRGNVAIADRTGVTFATATERRELVDIAYPDRKSAVDIANAWRPWIVGGLWLATSLLLVSCLHGLYRRRRKSPG